MNTDEHRFSEKSGSFAGGFPPFSHRPLICDDLFICGFGYFFKGGGRSARIAARRSHIKSTGSMSTVIFTSSGRVTAALNSASSRLNRLIWRVSNMI